MRMRISRNYKALEGHPRTKQRQVLLELISESEGHVDARELIKLAMAKDDSISQATVYRNLNLFKEMGLVEEKRLGHGHCYYEAKREGQKQHQHLVCNGCGAVIDFDCPLSEIAERVKREQGFTVTKAEVYFEGYCKECGKGKE
jgi:Fur family transcriptional regulator, ferric uptake regulator